MLKCLNILYPILPEKHLRDSFDVEKNPRNTSGCIYDYNNFKKDFNSGTERQYDAVLIFYVLLIYATPFEKVATSL